MQHRQTCLSVRPLVPCILFPKGFLRPGGKHRYKNRKFSIRPTRTHLFDVRNLGGEALRDLRDYFLYQCLVFHCLTGFHDSAIQSAYRE